MKKRALMILAIGLIGIPALLGCSHTKAPQKPAGFVPRSVPMDFYQQNVDVFAVIVDSSFKMMQSSGERTQLNLAKTFTDRLIRTLPADLKIKSGLISFGPGPGGKNVPRFLSGPADHSPADFRAATDKIGLTFGGDIRISDAMDLASDALSEIPGKKALFVVSRGRLDGAAMEGAARRIKEKFGKSLSLYAMTTSNDPALSDSMEKIAGQCARGFLAPAQGLLEPHQMADFVKRTFMIQRVDTDEDGVPDQMDQCPDTPSGADIDTEGCALDSDKDGVYDYRDACPGTPGGAPVDEKGCPMDQDKDGVYDHLDRCPDTPSDAPVDEKGCLMDQDEDGVYDHLDQCPDTPANVKVCEKGCPYDHDKDGVYDYLDACPGTPAEIEKVDAAGCPFDTDKDGIYDYLDQCADTPANVKTDEKGCPLDHDGDGVYDYMDACPGTPAQARKVDAEGCPFDADKDGVYDYLDQCPGTPPNAGRINEKGCWSISPIFFDYKKADIKTEGLGVLNEVGKILVTNPSVKVTVFAYTDGVGSSAYNARLAKKRGLAVKDYLLGMGIEESRVSIASMGLKNPRSSNLTEKGRAMNRRVEIRTSR
ncbi:exported hypothetical protein [Candidatus Desulfarcum epimagneticum]|uniref:OmpA-like domain-containing protein n=1 Tax=uncultured Desulfobacteraceae bacterium TaxID=218296 RepID=A0A484HKT8_9BACT|nr:exported hypothetical protein [uncultured Desulfobacteraceae bacterium]